MQRQWWRLTSKQAVTGKWQAIAAVCLAALLTASCGPSMQLTGNSTTGAPGNRDATLSLNKTSIGFGNVQVGTTKSISIVLTNTSASDGPTVTFTQVSVGGGFGVSTASLPIVLAPSQSSTITLSFSPKTTGAVKGSLSITVDGAADPAEVPVTGTGIGAAELAVSPSTLSFGSVAVGSSLNKTGALTAGTSDVKVSSAAWSGQGYALSGITFPVTVPAGKSVSFTVTFTPEATGSSQGSVSFVSNAANSPTVEMFTGSGSQTQSQNPGGVQHTVNLAWDASSSSSVVGYYMYRGTQSGGPYSRLNSSPQAATDYSDDTVASGQTYYYVVTSVDSASAESSYSNQAKVVVPTP